MPPLLTMAASGSSETQYLPVRLQGVTSLKNYRPGNFAIHDL